MSNKPGGQYDAPPPYSPQQAPIGFAPPGSGAPYPPQQPQTVYGQQSSSSTVHVVHTQPTHTAYVVPVAASNVCPACRVGVLTGEFTCCGIFLAILLFPIGFICCFMMMERRCTNCRAVYS